MSESKSDYRDGIRTVQNPDGEDGFMLEFDSGVAFRCAIDDKKSKWALKAGSDVPPVSGMVYADRADSPDESPIKAILRIGNDLQERMLSIVKTDKNDETGIMYLARLQFDLARLLLFITQRISHPSFLPTPPPNTPLVPLLIGLKLVVTMATSLDSEEVEAAFNEACEAVGIDPDELMDEARAEMEIAANSEDDVPAKDGWKPDGWDLPTVDGKD